MAVFLDGVRQLVAPGGSSMKEAILALVVAKAAQTLVPQANDGTLLAHTTLHIMTHYNKATKGQILNEVRKHCTLFKELYNSYKFYIILSTKKYVCYDKECCCMIHGKTLYHLSTVLRIIHEL